MAESLPLPTLLLKLIEKVKNVATIYKHQGDKMVRDSFPIANYIYPEKQGKDDMP